MKTALAVALEAAQPTPTELAIDRIAAGSMQADPRSKEGALRRALRVIGLARPAATARPAK